MGNVKFTFDFADNNNLSTQNKKGKRFARVGAFKRNLGNPFTILCNQIPK